MPFVGQQLDTNYTAITALGATTRLGSINSIQRGSVTALNASATGTATISAVTVARTELRFLGSASNGTVPELSGWLALTNTTTVTLTHTSGTGSDTVAGFEVTEFTA